ncbi:MAG: O-antigen ligase family protein [Pseudomonas sp.]|uniref:O-antigen ligase family protein n=1 Tax=Pseudomonas sp. TaxID=306 RepID=UPI002721B5FE|nr:O-antigen ligase family protein [Pseudomonas sp.]MDO9616638.1 O-antigen ligase family protein [Pseudomonas sp.]MDP2445288.1 O-antigen ligase family protein [Pseudomonas sp.]MDZ4335443.1 O-antigen ligase family protein [Pseudomonas sp.]
MLLITFGYLWFLLGIAWAPSNKVYQQALVVLLWLPGLLSMVVFHQRLLELWRKSQVFCSLLLLFLAWAALSTLWTGADEPPRELKRVLYIGIFLVSLALLSSQYPERVWQGLAVAFVGLALSCCVSIYLFYIRDMQPLSARLEGIGQVGHPILGAYVMALVVIWGARFKPSGVSQGFLWGVLMLFALAFVLLGQSRGAMLALIAGISALLLLRGGRFVWMGGIVLMVVCWVGYELFAPFILARGLSYRPEIFQASLDMVMQNPFLGLGIGTDYRVVTSNYPEGFDHTHNGFTHVAVELGVPGVILWIGLWLSAFHIAWQHRFSAGGRLVFGTLVVSLAALQFDAASLWGTPRAEWFVVWLPLALTLALIAQPHSVRLRSACIEVS